MVASTTAAAAVAVVQVMHPLLTAQKHQPINQSNQSIKQAINQWVTITFNLAFH